MLTIYIFIVTIILAVGYFFYGKFLEKVYNIKTEEEVPSKTMSDGVDYIPANKWVLLGHHFSSIAGAGPIVGPVIAGIAFGWLPSILWIVIGTIFIGGVHDFSALIISVRHQGKSIAEVANKYINKRTYKIFLVFIWFALMYVVAVFADIAADTFAQEPSVAGISILYILIAIIFGLLVYRLKFNLSVSTIIMIILIIVGIMLSLKYQFIKIGKPDWIIILLIYCFFASILPVWLLLQPRDYLSSYLLYVSVIIGLIGTIFGGYNISYPAIKSFNVSSVGPMIPFMFITIACGAVSGFHSLVASGTTSKQLDNIKNARFIGYGGMVLEGVVAMIALGTVMILSQNNNLISSPPAIVYANGIGNFSSLLGINLEVGKIFGLLVISAFVLTTLDTATRIARYIFQELTGTTSNKIITRVSSTIISLLLPIILLNIKLCDAKGNFVPCWKIIWPLFGATNQLLAALVLVIIYVWTKKVNYRFSGMIIVPAIFMLSMTLSALGYTIWMNVSNKSWGIITIIAIVLLLLGITVVVEVIRTLKYKTYTKAVN